MLGEIPERRSVMKTVSIFLALVNSLFAGFLIALDLSYHGIHQSIPWWSLLKWSAASLVIVVGASAWLEVIGVLPPGPVLLGSLFLVALGPSTIVWAIHVALTTGDLEYHMAVYGGSLMIQGITSLLGEAGDARNVTAS